MSSDTSPVFANQDVTKLASDSVESSALGVPKTTDWRWFAYQAMRVLWAGGLWVGCAVLVPSLFQLLDRQHAAMAATAIFRSLGVIGFFLIAALYVLRSTVGASKAASFALIAALLANAALQFGVVPMLIQNANAVEKEPMWHVLATALFLMQMVCAAVVALDRLDAATPVSALPSQASRDEKPAASGLE